jgi:hypothetical protein
MKRKIFIAIAAIFFIVVMCFHVSLNLQRTDKIGFSLYSLDAMAFGYQCSSCGQENCSKLHGVWRVDYTPVYWLNPATGLYEISYYAAVNNCVSQNTSSSCY